MFVTLQLLDIYTTKRGLEYECVAELNPIIGEVPSVGKMFFTKTAVLTPAIMYDLRHHEDVMDKHTMTNINTLMTIVILNNYDVYRSARKSCKKR